MERLLELKDLNFSYGEEKILTNINLTFMQGEFIGITGKNGSGKSTLAKILAGLERSQSGGVFFDCQELTEENIANFRQSLSMVFQNPNNQIIANRVIDDMAFGLENIGMPRAEMTKKIYETSRLLGIEKLLKKNPQELSGGQKQIVAIAGILLFNPKVIILDEITSMLDQKSKNLVFSLIKKLRDKHTIIMISHDSKELAQCDRVVLLHKGQVAHDKKAKSFFRDIKLLEEYGLEEPFDFELMRRLGEEFGD